MKTNLAPMKTQQDNRMINNHGMTVGELVAFLKGVNPTARIIVETDPEGYARPLLQAERGSTDHENRVRLMAY